MYRRFVMIHCKRSGWLKKNTVAMGTTRVCVGGGGGGGRGGGRSERVSHTRTLNAAVAPRTGQLHSW